MEFFSKDMYNNKLENKEDDKCRKELIFIKY